MAEEPSNGAQSNGGHAAARLSWDDFRLVKAIIDARGLTGAADKLGLNHSTVFRRLAQVETNLGVTLFERHRTGYAPTPPAEEMAALAEQMEEGVAVVTRKIAGCALSPSGELRVTTSDTLLVHFLMPVFAAFREQYPSIRLDVVISNQALNLSKRDADVAIRATDNPPETLVGRRVATVEWALYGRQVDFPQADFPEGEIPESRLGDCNWISLGDDLASLKVARFVHERAAPERIAYKVNTVLGLTGAVECGLGIGPLPCFIAETRPALRRLTPPKPEFATSLWLLTHPDLRHSPRVRAFLDVAGAEIARRKAVVDCSAARGKAA